METRDAIMKRRSVRNYMDQAISDQDLHEILEAGLYAPSAVNLQPWYYVVVRSKEQMKVLHEIMAYVSEKLQPMLQEKFPQHPGVVVETTRFVQQLGGAPVCILAFQMKDDYEQKADAIVQSIAASIENIILAATDKGLGSCWITAPHETGMDEVLQREFAPGKGKLVAMIALGYPARESKTPARKEGRYIMI